MAVILPKIGFNMAWHGLYMVANIEYYIGLLRWSCKTVQWKFELFQTYRGWDIAKIAQTWPYYGQNIFQKYIGHSTIVWPFIAFQWKF